jgi:hypothetical protein
VTGVYSQQNRCGISGRSTPPKEGLSCGSCVLGLGEAGAAGRLLTEPYVGGVCPHLFLWEHDSDVEFVGY